MTYWWIKHHFYDEIWFLFRTLCWCGGGFLLDTRRAILWHNWAVCVKRISQHAWKHLMQWNQPHKCKDVPPKGCKTFWNRQRRTYLSSKCQRQKWKNWIPRTWSIYLTISTWADVYTMVTVCKQQQTNILSPIPEWDIRSHLHRSSDMCSGGSSQYST